MKTLYKFDSKGNIRIWTIESNPLMGRITVRHGLFNGSMQIKEELVKLNASGRSIQEQTALQVQAKIKKQLDAGYRETIAEARANPGLNSLGLPNPMLALPLANVSSIDFNNCWAQYKYNGHRCLMAKVHGTTQAYSRNGLAINTLDHITPFIDSDIPLDGELYVHNERLQTISSWVKAKQLATKCLKYVIYDCVIDAPYKERLDYLKSLKLPDTAMIAPTVQVAEYEVGNMLQRAKAEGYEGLILRQDDFGYEMDKRSKSLIKVKETMDDEFMVIDVVPAKDGWGILVCEMPDKKTFKVSAPGSFAEKMHIIENKASFIGRKCTVEFMEYTADGIPFHPVALPFDSKIDR